MYSIRTIWIDDNPNHTSPRSKYQIVICIYYLRVGIVKTGINDEKTIINVSEFTKTFMNFSLLTACSHCRLRRLPVFLNFDRYNREINNLYVKYVNIIMGFQFDCLYNCDSFF